jgi:ABC-type transport system substrate-binding protein
MLFFDDEIDAAVNDASAELDEDTRVEKVKTAQKLIMEKEAPMINIYSSVSFIGRRSWLKNVVIGRGSYGLFSGTTWIDTAMRSS